MPEPPIAKKKARRHTPQVMALTGVGMGLTLLTEVLIASRLGARGLTDALILALSMPRLLANVGREATKFSLLTVFVRVDERQGEQALRDLAQRVLNLFLLIGLMLTLAAVVWAGPLMRLLGPGLDPDSLREAQHLLRFCAPVAIFALGSAVLEVTLNCRHRFTITATRNTVAPLVVVLIILATWPLEHVARWIAGGLSLGYGCFFVLLLMRARKEMGLRLDLRRWPDRRAMRELRGTIAYPLLGFGVRQGSRMAERSIASLAGPGGVTAYYLAYHLLGAVQNLVGVSIALTGQPRLTRHDLAGDQQRFGRLLRRRVLYSLAVSLPIAAGVTLLHRPIVDLLYGHGRFGAEAVAATSGVLMILGPAIVFYCLIPVLSSALYARKRFGAVLYNMTLAGATNILLAWVMFRWWGLTGVALAALAASCVAVVNLALLLRTGPARAASAVPGSAIEPQP